MIVATNARTRPRFPFIWTPPDHPLAAPNRALRFVRTRTALNVHLSLQSGAKASLYSVFRRESCAGFARYALPIARLSISVPMKQRNASVGEHTMGSPRTLNEVLTTTGQPVRRLNSERSAW